MTIVETKDSVSQAATPTRTAAEAAVSSPGPVTRGMRLRVSRDKPRASNIVELASRRCFVGSAPNCHVRLEEPGVAPIECLIIQGSKSNIVRWLVASRQVTGDELFEDEIIYAGDPLQIGPVELELLVDELMSADEPSRSQDLPGASEDRLAEYVLRLERLESQLGALQQASEVAIALSAGVAPTNGHRNHEVAATISDLAAQLAVLQSRSASDRGMWASEKADLEALLQSRRREFDFLQDEVRRLRDELVSVRDEFVDRLTNDQATERLAEVSQVLAERTEDFEQQQAKWAHDRSEFQRQLRQNTQRIEQFEIQLARQSERQAESDAARQAAEARADRLQESVDELSKRLAEQQEDYEAVRVASDADRASLESELAETRQRLALSVSAESDAQQLYENWNRERAELKSQVTEAISRAEQIQHELETQQRLSERQAQSDCESLLAGDHAEQVCQANEQYLDGDVSVPSRHPIDRLLASHSVVDDHSDDREEPSRDFLASPPMLCDDEESEYQADNDSASGYGRGTGVTSSYYDPAARDWRPEAYLDEVTAEDRPYGNPLLAANQRDDLGGAIEPAESQLEAGPEEVFDERPRYEPSSASPFAPLMADNSSRTDDEEESIEAYMARLMNRVRGTEIRSELPRPTPSTVERGPVTEYTEVMKSAQPDRGPVPEKFEPEEYRPRSQAPEAADRMTAMRSLANDSARTAIASHAKRNWSSIMKQKLFVSMFALISVLASLIFFWGEPVLMALGSLLGVIVLAYWAHNAVTYRKLLLDSLMLEPVVGSDQDESPKSEEEVVVA